jgi:hypothetical protein
VSYNAAQIQGGKAVLRTKPQRYLPKEASRILGEFGIVICEQTIRRRCNLPAGHPLRILRLATFSRRYWIPESEVFRLAGISEGAE